MTTIIICTIHPWNKKQAESFRDSFENYDVHIITDKNELNYDTVKTIAPKYIFFPHWSWIIPSDIYDNFTCVVFHMTDLPYGRGGSPLQNLIALGVKETKISAIKVCKELDAGDIYMKMPLSLYGGAEEIYMRASDIIFREMIPYILEQDPEPTPQEGNITCFKRRTPVMSRLTPDMTLAQIFDYIRMLDAEGYPRAYVELGEYRFSFSRPKMTAHSILSDVEIEVVNHDQE